MFNSFRRRWPIGSTDWAAQQFLEMLDREEREKIEREHLREAGWQPADLQQGFTTGEPTFGDGRDAVADLVQRDIDYDRALQEEARRRSVVGALRESVDAVNAVLGSGRGQAIAAGNSNFAPAAANTASRTLSTTVTLWPFSPTKFAKEYFEIPLPSGLYGPVRVQIRAVSSPTGVMDPTC